MSGRLSRGDGVAFSASLMHEAQTRVLIFYFVKNDPCAFSLWAAAGSSRKKNQRSKNQTPSWERTFTPVHLRILSRCPSHASNVSSFYPGLCGPGLRNSGQGALIPSDARLFKKVNGFEEEESMKRTAHQPEGGDASLPQDVNGLALTVFSCGGVPTSEQIRGIRRQIAGRLPALCFCQVPTFLNPGAICHHHPSEGRRCLWSFSSLLSLLQRGSFERANNQNKASTVTSDMLGFI